MVSQVLHFNRTVTVRAMGFITTPALFALLLLLPSAPLAAQEHEPAEEAAAEHGGMHPNHFGGFLGLSAHSDADHPALTMGLEYARVFSRHWAAVAYVELVSSQLERDVIVAVGGIYYPLPGLGLVLAVGAEGAEKDTVEGEHVESETEVEFLVRAGVGYGFRIAESAAIGPVFLVDRAPGRTTFVFGLAILAGF